MNTIYLVLLFICFVSSDKLQAGTQPTGNQNQAQTLPAQTVIPAQTLPAPDQNSQAQNLPAQTITAQTLPAQTSTAQTLPLQTLTAQALPDQTQNQQFSYAQGQIPVLQSGTATAVQYPPVNFQAGQATVAQASENTEAIPINSAPYSAVQNFPPMTFAMPPFSLQLPSFTVQMPTVQPPVVQPPPIAPPAVPVAPLSVQSPSITVQPPSVAVQPSILVQQLPGTAVQYTSGSATVQQLPFTATEVSNIQVPAVNTQATTTVATAPSSVVVGTPATSFVGTPATSFVGYQPVANQIPATIQSQTATLTPSVGQAAPATASPLGVAIPSPFIAGATQPT